MITPQPKPPVLTSPPPYTESPYAPTLEPSTSVPQYHPYPHAYVPAQQGHPSFTPLPQSPFAQHAPGAYPYAIVPPQQHGGFGPTPLTQQQALLPYAYYDLRSPHSLALADARARWRFVGALAGALGVWVLVGFVIGVEVDLI